MPDNIIIKRGTFFRLKEFEMLYDLYSDDSVIKKLFNNAYDYREYMLSNNKITILSEKIVLVKSRGSLANVVFSEELLMADGSRQDAEVSTYLRLENGKWLITREERKYR